VNPYLGVALGAIVGVVVGLVAGFVLARTLRAAQRARRAAAGLSLAPPVVPDGTDELLGVLGSAVVLVGPHDEVLRSTAHARAFGLVRGDRVILAEVLDLARSARARAAVETADLVVRRGPTGMVARTEAADHGEDRSAGPAGTWFWSVRAAPLRAGLVLVLVEDRTAVRRADQTRHDFVVNVSHELKTPIGAMLLLAETIQTASDDAEAVERFAGRLIVEADRLNLLVRQLIDLSRLQGDEQIVAHAPVALDEVLAGALDRCRVDADRRGVTLTRTGEHGLVVDGDAPELENAVGNLIENAVAYSDTGGRVVLSARHVRTGGTAMKPADVGGTSAASGGWVEIAVSDNGIGIAEADLDRIFERFYRVDYARSRANGGTGLGLSIVKHVAASHGGSVQVWSRPGQGSTFTIRLPVGVGGSDRTPEALASPDITVRGAAADSTAPAASHPHEETL